MSQADQQDERIQLCIRRSGHVEKWRDAKRQIAADHDIPPDALTRPQVIEELADAYLDEGIDFDALLSDKRIREARQVVADDHGMDPDDVSVRCLLKVTSGAYMGHTQTVDWELSETGEENE